MSILVVPFTRLSDILALVSAIQAELDGLLEPSYVLIHRDGSRERRLHGA